MSKARRVAAAVIVLLMKRKKERVKKRRIWVRNWISRRGEVGAHDKLLRELLDEDSNSYKNSLCMSHVDYEYLLERVALKIKKEDTHFRKAISPSERLTLTLRFLASGDSYHSLMHLFRIPVATISKIIPEVCEALFDVLKGDYLKIPNSNEEWYKEAEDFEKIWNFPNCIGALDGRHVVLKATKNSERLYFNYKGTHSIVLMALVNANYKFLYIDVGCNGPISDGEVFTNCSLASAVENNLLNIPDARPLQGQSNPTPFVVVADDAFALKPYLLKPFPSKNQPGPNRVFNYRLSRAHSVVENAFGLMSARFCILRRPMELPPGKVKNIVLCICALHNFLLSRKNSTQLYAPPEMFDNENEGTHIPGSWRQKGITETTLFSLQRTNMTKNSSKTAKYIRDQFKNYFTSEEGEVPWQYKYI